MSEMSLDNVHVKQEGKTSVCFVCGELGTEYTLHSRSHEQGAFFPFLEQQKPPIGADGPDIDGAVSACFVCYSFLLQQWDHFELNNTPYPERAYWLNRADDVPVANMEAAELLALEFSDESLELPEPQNNDSNLDSSGSHASSSVEPQRTYPALYYYLMNECLDSTNIQMNLDSESSMSETAVPHIPPRPSSNSSLSSSSHVPRRPSSPFPSASSHAPSRPSSQFSSTSSHVPSRPSSQFSSPSSPVPSRPSSQFSSASLPVLSRPSSQFSSLSSPVPSTPSQFSSSSPHFPNRQSSNSSRLPSAKQVEHACYVCGDSSSNSVFFDMYVKPFSNFPFFPPLATLPKPAKARRMTDSGKVECCNKCHTHLVLQWISYQRANVPCSERYYHFRNSEESLSLDRQSTKCREASFVCFTCGYEDFKSLPKVVNIFESPKEITTLGMVQNDSCFQFLKWHRPAPRAKPMSKDGHIYLCSLCYKSLILQFAVYEMAATPHEQRVYKVANSYAGDNNHLVDKQSSEESCLLCKKRGCSLILVETEPQDAKAFFPFLKGLDQRYSHNNYQGRVPVCVFCFNNLVTQWQTFEGYRVPHSQRSYRYSIGIPESVATSPTLISSQNISWARHNEVSSSDDCLPDSNDTQDTTQNPPRVYDPLELPVTTNPLPVSTTCFICAEYSPPGSLYYICAFPANGHEVLNGDGRTCTPFFPFLATHVPSSGAQRLTEDGKAMVCTFCCHSLQAQWLAYETSPHVEDSNRWLRKYNLESCKYGISFVEM